MHSSAEHLLEGLQKGCRKGATLTVPPMGMAAGQVGWRRPGR